MKNMENNYKEIISAIGEDINRNGLVDTPKRAAKAMEFLTQGYQKNIDDVVNGVLFESDADEMVVVKILSCIQCVNTTCYLL